MGKELGAGAVVAGIVRGVVVTILFVGTFWVFDLADGEETGANIGAGLAAFALTALVAGVWGLLDGRRRGFVPAAVGWVVAAVVLVVANAIRMATTTDLVDAEVLGFVGGLVLVPGLVGAAIGDAVTSRR